MRPLVAVSVLLAGQIAVASPARAADPPLLYPSLISGTWEVMRRCGELEWRHKVCAVRGGLTEADRAAVAARWRREGFHPRNIAEMIGRWRGRFDLRMSAGDRNVDGWVLEEGPKVHKPLTSPEACRAARASAERDAAACRRAAILCAGRPCDLVNLPRRLPGELLILSGMPISDCGYYQLMAERCAIRGGVDAAMRQRAFDALRRAGFHPEDVAVLEDYWQDGYDGKARETLAAGECATNRARAEIAKARALCRRVRVVCERDNSCARFKPARGKAK